MASFLRSSRIVMPARASALLSILAVALGAIVTCVSSAGSLDGFTVALIPDTQYYGDPTTSGTPEMYYALTGWIADRAAQDKIRFAIHLGDLVQTANDQSQWELADAAQRTLEWSVPYSVLPGNHDLDSLDYYNQYFGPDRFAGQAFYGGHEGTTNNNNYCFFTGGGMRFMVLSLEFDPSPETLQWAAQVVEDHPNHRVIVASHEYLSLNGRRAVGNRIWNNLVRDHDNIFMVVSGHISGWAHQTSTNDAGHPVIEILTDYQWEPDGLDPTVIGGDGWLNTMRFVPAEDKIHFKSYSPYLNEWRTTPLHEYTLDYQMPDVPPGDANGDGVVDDQDARILTQNWLKPVTDGSFSGDFNEDRVVNDLDASILAAHWNYNHNTAIVPEPLLGTLLLSLCLFVGVLRPKQNARRQNVMGPNLLLH